MFMAMFNNKLTIKTIHIISCENLNLNNTFPFEKLYFLTYIQNYLSLGE